MGIYSDENNQTNCCFNAWAANTSIQIGKLLFIDIKEILSCNAHLQMFSSSATYSLDAFSLFFFFQSFFWLLDLTSFAVHLLLFAAYFFITVCWSGIWCALFYTIYYCLPHIVLTQTYSKSYSFHWKWRHFPWFQF